ncbi:hypothetical protein H6P81_003682 [Aristolochia fimbriata]|uniref:Bifunctional inhibitor/plant lipid transfer protein/seed storage helical domain-containing protein n=1 Tax=Aristolochia fimbriata TaxID=158543 RepID=A0AAV7FF92_ARIFI|nr:hypothetical protein H6P81_003682 [Aristolochia fimbriata]
MAATSVVPSRSILLITVVVIVGAVVLLSCPTTAQFDDPCNGDFQLLAQYCAPYVQVKGPQVPPSKECCDAIRRCDVPCVCSHLTSGQIEMISSAKVAYVANYCGRPLPPGTKYGYYKSMSESDAQGKRTGALHPLRITLNNSVL